MTKNWIIKDLRVIGRRELKDIVILENSVISFATNLDNGIYIPSYEDDHTDQELLPIIDFLKNITDVDDVRLYVREFAGVCKLFSDYKSKA
jgi:TFIIF-interacting CTD phosphatase-like protein